MTPDQVPASAYTEAYFSTIEGYEEYLRSGGRVLTARLAEALRIAGDIRDQRVLDLGCGRGEVLLRCLDEGAWAVGVDYAVDALRMTQRILPERSALLVQADAQALPFATGAFDLILALDIVEHLHQPQLERMLAEAHRLLAPGGRLIVHTMPNLWYYRFGYPLFRLVQRLRGVRLPRNPRDRLPYVKLMHVNEQSVVSLARNLRAAGFDSRLWLRNMQDFARESNRLVRAVSRFLAGVYPFAWIFCSDVFALATKEGQARQQQQS
jgi:ubiquinone/menaquinone biosynthesis C-methylase UbiE